MEFQSYPSPQSSPSRGEEIGGGGDLSGIKNIVDSDTLWKIWITLASYPHFPYHLDNFKDAHP